MSIQDLQLWIYGWFRYDVTLIKQVLKGQQDIMATLADLQAKVAANTTVIESALTLIQGISDKLKEALAQNNPEAIQAVIDELDAEDKKLADAVAANTPSA